METALKEIESQLNLINEHLERIETSDNPDYDFEETLRSNREFYLKKKDELLQSLMPAHQGDSDLPDSGELSPIIHHKTSSFSSVSSSKDPLRSVHSIPENLLKKHRSSSFIVPPTGIFKKSTATHRLNSPSANRYNTAVQKIKSEKALVKSELKGVDTNDDDLVELGRLSIVDSKIESKCQMPPRSPPKRDRRKKDSAAKIDSRQRDLIQSLVGVGNNNFKKIIHAVSKKNNI